MDKEHHKKILKLVKRMKRLEHISESELEIYKDMCKKAIIINNKVFFEMGNRLISLMS